METRGKKQTNKQKPLLKYNWMLFHNWRPQETTEAHLSQENKRFMNETT